MGETAAQRVCIVDDDPDTRALIRRELESLHYKTTEFGSGNEALSDVRASDFDLLILDVGLPDIDGFEVCRRLRAAGLTVPIIFVTSRAEEIDRVSGFALGADDYVTKPFSSRELGFRVRALLRRSLPVAQSNGESQGSPRPDVLDFGPLSIDVEKRRVTLHSAVLPLTALEYDVLVHLALNPGKPFSRDELAEEVWGITSSNYGPTVTTLLNRLRRKLEPDIGKPTFILTVYGVGYRFVDPSVDPIEA